MHALTIGSFVFFTALVGVITWILTRRDDHKSSDGYFLAGRTLTGGYIAGSLLLTNLSTEQLVGLNGAAFKDGISVMAWEVIAGASLVVMAWFFLPRFLKSGIATVPQYLEERFDQGTRAITTYLFIIAYAVILLPIILYSGATGLNSILNMKELTGIQSDAGVLWFTVWLVGIIGSIYAIFGGLRTVAVSDTINGFGLLVGGVMITIFGLNAISEGNFIEGFKILRESNPEKFNSLGGAEQSVPWHTLFSGVLLLNLFYWCTNQQIIQRTLGAKNLAEGQKGVLFAGTLKILAPMILVLPGLIAFHLYKDRNLANDNAYGTLVSNVLPPPLVGFFAAVMVGAILSSFNSALNSTATLYSLGIYKAQMHPSASQEKLIASGKYFGIGIAIVSMTAAPFLAGQESIFKYLQDMNSIYFIPLFAVCLIGLFNKRAPAISAKVALVLGVVLMCLGSFVIKDTITGAWGIHFFHYMGLVFALLLLLMFVWGKVRPMPVAFVQRDSGAVDMTPWKLAKPYGIVLFLIVLVLYLSLADFSALKS